MLSPNLFDFLPDEIHGDTDEESVRDPSDGARLVDCYPEMLVEEAALVMRPEQTAASLGAGVSQCLEVQEKHMWLRMECLPGPLSSPVIMAPDDCMHLVHKLSPPTFGVVKRAPRSSNELSPRGSIEVVTRFSNDMRQVPSVGTRGVTDLVSPAYPVHESSLGFNVLELRTPLDPPRFSESFPHNQHPYRDDG